MKKCMVATFLLLIAIGFLFPVSGMCQDMSNAEIMKELKALKERIIKLEKALGKKDQEIKELKAETAKGREVAAAEGGIEKWTDKIDISGAIEVEYGVDKHDIKGGPTTRDEDLVLATVELGIGAQINKYVRGDIVLLYEEDDNEDFSIDEGTITVGGIEETFGLYFKGGKYYPHFGELNSYFISDPLTLEMFEIQESAAEISYDGNWFSAGAGVFNGDIDEIGDRENDVRGFFADVNFHNPEDSLGGLSLLIGVSYLSNVADSDTLQDENNVDLDGDGDPDMVINDDVDGVATYLVAEYGQFSFGAEYITGLDDFMAGEMAYAVDRNGIARATRPSAWNLEFAFRPIDTVQLAIKYEGTDEMFGLFPEDQYGFVVSWELFRYTTLSAEYLHGEYDDDNLNADGNIEDSRDVFTIQLAVEF